MRGPRRTSGAGPRVTAMETSESYAAGETTPALIEETIGENFARIAREHADREALVEVATGRRWTYAELERDVDALARGLIAAGIAKGDRVGIWSPNCAEWTIVQYATAKIGAVLVNVNPAYGPTSSPTRSTSRGWRSPCPRRTSRAGDYRAMVDEVVTAGAGSDAAPRAGGLLRHVGLGPVAQPGRGAAGRRRRGADGDAVQHRPDQHPVHVGHDRLPRARRCRTATSSTTGSSPPS